MKTRTIDFYHSGSGRKQERNFPSEIHGRISEPFSICTAFSPKGETKVRKWALIGAQSFREASTLLSLGGRAPLLGRGSVGNPRSRVGLSAYVARVGKNTRKLATPGMNHLLIYPMFAMVLLTVTVLAALFRSRVQAVQKGEVSPYYYKTYQGESEPESSVKLARHFVNIFEAPTLFYAACLAGMILGNTTMVFHILAWSYVMVRALHAFIHTGSNKLKPRIAVYFTSWVVLFMMWSSLAIQVGLEGLRT